MVQPENDNSVPMKITAFLLTVILVAMLQVPAAFADACSNRARQIASSMNAQVIAVQSQQGSNGSTVCVARFKVNSPGQPSRIVTRTFRP